MERFYRRALLKGLLSSCCCASFVLCTFACVCVNTHSADSVRKDGCERQPRPRQSARGQGSVMERKLGADVDSFLSPLPLSWDSLVKLRLCGASSKVRRYNLSHNDL